MLKNARNESKSKYLCRYCCSEHNNKSSRREIKHSMKRKEANEWKSELQDDRDFMNAQSGEVWELKHSGDYGLWICNTENGFVSFWESWDGQWLIIEDEDFEAISEGRFTGVTLSC